MAELQANDVIIVYRGGQCFRATAQQLGCAGATVESLAAIEGEQGPPGEPGLPGEPGADGEDGADSVVPGPPGTTDYNALQNKPTLGTLAAQNGTFSGTSSGTNTGDQTSVSGNAGTATTLQTSRNINGVAFNGSANITVTADFAATGGGYTAGAGGTVTQLTSKATGVTLNKPSGEITMHNAALAAAAIVSFTLTDSAIAAKDTLILNHVTTGTRGAYNLNAQCQAGSAIIYVRNNTAGSLGEAIVLRFTLVKGVTA